MSMQNNLVILSQTVTELFDSLAGRTRFTHFCAVLGCILQPSEAMFGRFVRPIVPDKCVKFRDPCLNRCLEIPSEAAGSGIFNSF